MRCRGTGARVLCTWLATLALPACHKALKASHGDAGADGGGDLATVDGATEAAAGNACTGVVQLTADLYHACAVKADGTLWCWGGNGYGQLGDGTFVDRTAPVPVTALGSDVVQAATGYDFTCAVKRDFTLWCWGAGQAGQLANGQQPGTPTAIPTQVLTLGSAIAEVAAGGQRACARKGDGTLWCWGSGFAGDGSAAGAHATPVMVSGLGAQVAGVSVSWYHTCARLSDGSLWCWGSNVAGELGDGTTNLSQVPVQVAGIGNLTSQVSTGHQDTCATRSDGTLWCWGWRSGTKTPAMVSSLGTDVVEVAAGWAHFCARKRDGTLWCWGYNGAGQLGDGSTTSKDATAPVAVATGTVDVAVANGFTCAALSGGALRCWGGYDLGQLGNGMTTAEGTPRAVASLGTSVAQVAAGNQFFCARMLDGAVACWGIDWANRRSDGSYGDQPTPLPVSALGQPAAHVAGGGAGTACVVSTAGEVWCWGWISNATGGFDQQSLPVQVAGLPAGIVEVALGWGHACALASDGTLWCWGRNDDGQLGDGTSVFFRDTPVEVAALGASVTHVTARGGTHTCARTADSMLWCWGSNYYGELGDGTTDGRATPLPVTALGPHVRQASAGPIDQTCAVLDDGTAWCWGRNDNGELGNGSLDQSVVPVQVAGLAAATEVDIGFAHACARTSDGALWCWGANGAGQLGTGGSGQVARSTTPVRVAGLAASVADFAVGSGATCARGENGSLWCWGSQDFGMLADGAVGFTPLPVAPAGCL